MAQQDSYDKPWVTDGAWITGLAGVFAIIGTAYFCQATHLLDDGLDLLGTTLFTQRPAGMLFSLGVVTFVMIAVEVFRLWKFDKRNFIQIDPLIKQKQYTAFFLDSFKRFILLVILFWVVKLSYHSLNEYGFRAKHDYYQPWFYFVERLWTLFLFTGLPYILLTRAFKHNPTADKKDLALLTQKSILCIASYIPSLKYIRKPFTIVDKRSVLGLIVKFFFTPLMTVFFFDNFGNLVNGIDFLANDLMPHIENNTYTMELFHKNAGEIGLAMIFSFDVGLAWCGYVVSSRWVDNQTISAEPTLLGWTVCLICYPPFRVVNTFFLTAPDKDLLAQMPHGVLTTILGALVILSFFVYMLPTIWFGIRFSNLTHRGIIRKGPFAIVRHPAYASKNLAWWCVGFPMAIYVGYTDNLIQGLAYVGGLILLTWIYYMRAITEERHLSMDPDYIDYCKHVKYRFIPGVI